MTPQEAFRELFVMATTWQPLIYANQNAPKPDTPFAVMHLMSTDPLPRHVGAVNDQGYRDLYQTMPLSARVQFVGDGSWMEAQRFSLMLETQEVHTRAYELNISVNSRDSVQDISTTLPGGFWQPRVVVGLSVAYTMSIEEWVSWIERVEGEWTISGEPDLPFAADIRYN